MTRRQTVTGIISLAGAFVIFVVPFLFVLINAMKTPQDASQLDFSLPEQWVFWQNLVQTVQTRDYALLLAYWNSIVITVGAMTLLVIFGAMVGYVVQRRPGPVSRIVYMVALSGLMIPPAVVPTIWLLQEINLFKTLTGMIFIQCAYGLGFTVLLYRNFIGTIPRERSNHIAGSTTQPLSAIKLWRIKALSDVAGAGGSVTTEKTEKQRSGYLRVIADRYLSTARASHPTACGDF